MARAQTYAQKRAEELEVMIATIKVKHKLTNAQLAKKLGIPESSFKRYKGNVGEFRQRTVWMLELLANKGESQ